MDPRNHQGGYGEAFVSALAMAAGLRQAKPLPDIDGIDLCLWPDGTGTRRGARAPGINVQVNSRSSSTGPGGCSPTAPTPRSGLKATR